MYMYTYIYIYIHIYIYIYIYIYTPRASVMVLAGSGLARPYPGYSTASTLIPNSCYVRCLRVY